MAEASDDALRLGATAQSNLVSFCTKILELNHTFSLLKDKFEFIDVAYARYNQLKTQNNGEDVFINELEKFSINLEEITMPVVVSHVDSYVGYFADVFLSGYPIFPVVSGPTSRIEAEALQSIIDTHATQGRYARQLLMSFYDASKYNLSGVELDWCPLNDYSLLNSYESIKKSKKIEMQSTYFNKLSRLDPYNLIFDKGVLPVDVPYCGEYAGYIELISRVELARLLAYYEKSGNGYNTAQAKNTGLSRVSNADVHYGYYRQPPQISSFLSNNQVNKKGFDWDLYLTGKGGLYSRRFNNCYEKTTIYARIIPALLEMNVPAKNTPQVWKFVFINHDKLIYAARQYNVYDTLPIYIGQPFEDGLGLQTQSLAESGIVFQEGASKLMSIRLNAARRAVMDRALYDPQMIHPNHLNNAMPAPKIPIRDNSRLNGKTLADAYMQIPFDSRGTETVLQDLNMLVGMADRLNGVNQPMQGQFQKGNKTRKEWVDTMEGATNRLRLRALSLELQQLLPIKEQIKFNIYQHGVAGSFQNSQTGSSYAIDPQKLQAIKDKISTFQIADGFHPTEKLAATEVLIQGMTLIGNSPFLQQAWGPGLPQMFAHLMSLGGVKGIEQYLPQQQPPQQAPAAQNMMPEQNMMPGQMPNEMPNEMQNRMQNAPGTTPQS